MYICPVLCTSVLPLELPPLRTWRGQGDVGIGGPCSPNRTNRTFSSSWPIGPRRRFQKSIAALAHRLRATQSPLENVHVRGQMEAVGAGLIRSMPEMAPCGAQADFQQIRSYSGAHRSRCPEPCDVRRAQMKFLRLYIWPIKGLSALTIPAMRFVVSYPARPRCSSCFLSLAWGVRTTGW